jgi:hypothetical protein
MSDHDNNAYETRKVGVAFPPFVPEDVRTFATPELVVPEPVLPTRLQKLLAWLRIKQLPEQPVYEVPVYDTPQAVLRARMHKDDAEGPFYLVNLSNNCENLDKRYGFAEILIQLLQPTQYDGWGNSNRAMGSFKVHASWYPMDITSHLQGLRGNNYFASALDKGLIALINHDRATFIMESEQGRAEAARLQALGINVKVAGAPRGFNDSTAELYSGEGEPLNELASARQRNYY